MRILIVEDDRLLGDGLCEGLHSLGFATDWFTDGAQADTALASAPYDAIVLDLGLPGRDGLEWLHGLQVAWGQRDDGSGFRVRVFRAPADVPGESPRKAAAPPSLPTIRA